MAELAHLEKMVRELKCPICLSLLKLAVSLPCNHVFCNLCILKSMRSVSDCPVCKVPFHRREVRTAPHMDNLVNIFKSMEVSAGIHILTTQVSLPANGSDGVVEGNVVKDIAKPKTIVACRGKSEKKGIPKEKKDKEAKENPKTFDSCSATMPSFPSKKRIHVMPFPVSETPTRPEKVPKIATLTIGSEAGGLDTKEQLTTAKNGKAILSPFFWMREESDDNEASEKPSTQQTADTPTRHHVPCFSDIKDYDNEIPTKMTPTSKPHVSKDFDSEMFEWTQGACSPELCSTPIKKKNADISRLGGIQEKIYDLNLQNDENARGSLLNKIAESSKTIDARMRIGKKRRSIRKFRENHIKTATYAASGSDLDKVLPHVLIFCTDKAENSRQKKENNQNVISLCPLRKCRKECNKHANSNEIKCVKRTIDQVNDPKIQEAPEPFHKISSNKENQMEDASDVVALENYTGLDIENKTSERIKRAKFQPGKRHMRSRGDAKAKILAVPSATVNELNNQNQENQHLNIGLPVICEQSSSVLFSKQSKEIQKLVEGSKRQARMRKQVYALEISKDGEKIIPASIERAEALCNQAPVGIYKKSESVTYKNSIFIPTSGEKILRKCENVHSQICCAFCQSSNDTEISGEMMHYFNGEPVVADYNGGTNVTHVHKHCTEWAPDVFFEGDRVINLVSELARSRRIKCCCCSIRGAALGCFEKSCRKSFHFTCAKLIKECQWDIENFVMLCPLHSSSKLPNESPELQSRSKRRATRKGEAHAPMVRRSGCEMSQNWKWPTGTPCKWILCCSALTIAGKEILSEFMSLTGIPVSKGWSPTVSHVITSTDENGACRRTLKFLMGIMEGKWILGINWIKECLKAMEPVDEQKFEIRVDIHGISGGPLLGRSRVIKKQPKLFNGFRFYFSGEFTPSYRGYLQDLIVAAGGMVLQRKPISRDHKLLDDFAMEKTFIVYSLELPEKHDKDQVNTLFNRQIEAKALADASGAKVGANTWILDSIAGCKLQPLI